MTKQKTWSYDQQIQYELARDTISSLKAILLRQSWVIENADKIKILQKRASELGKEVNHFDGFNDKIIKSVISTYSPLIREYYTMGTTEAEIASIGLPDKFFTTKVAYEKMG